MTTVRELERRFHAAVDAAELSIDDLWLRYFALGGEADRFELDAYLNGAIALPPLQHDVLAQAINERLREIAPPPAPFSEEFRHADDGGTARAS
jgi:hypothetical protein